MKGVKWILGIFLLGTGTIVNAQDIKFEKTNHDFGRVEPDVRNLRHTFKFTNTGEKPFKLESVKADCGCTTPDWSKEPISPEKKGEILVIFDATNQSGYFRKSITVKTSNNKIKELTIEGNIREKGTHANELGFPVQKGNLHFEVNKLAFGDVASNRLDTFKFRVFNESNNAVKIKKIKGPDYVLAPELPIEIKPFQVISFNVLFSGSSAFNGAYGTISGNIFLVTNDATYPSKAFKVEGRIYPGVDKLKSNEERPIAKLDRKTLNFGTIPSSYFIKTGVTISNKGQKPLRILGIDVQGCACLVSDPAKNKLKPNESTELKIEFRADRFEGRVRESIKIYTNDPKNPYLTIDIKATVEF